MYKKCIACKSKNHGFYYDVSSNKDFATEINRKVTEHKKLFLCEPCIKRVRTKLVHEGKNYQTLPAEILQTRDFYTGPDYIDDSSQQPVGQPLKLPDQQVEPPVESSQQPVNESVSSEQEQREVTFEKNIILNKPMPSSVKRKLLELYQKRIPNLSNAVQRKSNSPSIISNSRNNDSGSLKSVHSQAFIVGSCITSTQNNYYIEPVRSNNRSSNEEPLNVPLPDSVHIDTNREPPNNPTSLGSLCVQLSDSVNRQPTNNSSSLGSLAVPLTDSVNRQPSNNPTSLGSLCVQLTDSVNRQPTNNSSSLGSLAVPLTDSVNRQPSNNSSGLESIFEPLTDSVNRQQSNHRNSSKPVSFIEFAGVSTSRGHMRVRRASSEISVSSDNFIPIVFNNDDIISGNASYSSGREHSNVAAPSRITNSRKNNKNLGG